MPSAGQVAWDVCGWSQRSTYHLQMTPRRRPMQRRDPTSVLHVHGASSSVQGTGHVRNPALPCGIQELAGGDAGGGASTHGRPRNETALRFQAKAMVGWRDGDVSLEGGIRAVLPVHGADRVHEYEEWHDMCPAFSSQLWPARRRPCKTSGARTSRPCPACLRQGPAWSSTPPCPLSAAMRVGPPSHRKQRHCRCMPMPKGASGSTATRMWCRL